MKAMIKLIFSMLMVIIHLVGLILIIAIAPVYKPPVEASFNSISMSVQSMKEESMKYGGHSFSSNESEALSARVEHIEMQIEVAKSLTKNELFFKDKSEMFLFLLCLINLFVWFALTLSSFTNGRKKQQA